MELDTKIEDELKENQYLGTFRWKNVNFVNLSHLDINFFMNKEETLKYYISLTTNWQNYLDFRYENQEFEACFIDALSYPLSIIQIINTIIENKSSDALDSIRKNIINDISNKDKRTLNLILIGAAKKTEERIALQSNYYDEIYYFLLAYMIKSSTDKAEIEKIYNNFILNINFSGEEISSNSSYSSILNKNCKYSFYSQKTYEYLRVNSLEYNKYNSIIIGMNCGFGAGFKRLTLSWIKDLQLLFKIGYVCGFTYTNDYEDLKGEKLIIDYLQGKVIYTNENNNFKSMSVYKSESVDDNNNWSCGNYGFYLVKGLNKLISINDNDVLLILKDNNLLKNN